jgi:DNA invertase Pin-like site-specific DNA recombinase
MVAAWSVDRLGRSLTGLLELLTELHAKKELRPKVGDGMKG